MATVVIFLDAYHFFDVSPGFRHAGIGSTSMMCNMTVAHCIPKLYSDP